MTNKLIMNGCLFQCAVTFDPVDLMEVQDLVLLTLNVPLDGAANTCTLCFIVVYPVNKSFFSFLTLDGSVVR